ncbi:hypothetical protein [Actinomadura sp. DC4]|uniref:hypothetical protein n=1 Tax=Actinomadura sp. DC4 TaxID=3055069 RepID=UPI0025B23516|nr:hypothetical protein [Actinomadura sp. DC4]MDN3356262.1 hypothetical protein [Actinomadura sp. DC4]
MGVLEEAHQTPGDVPLRAEHQDGAQVDRAGGHGPARGPVQQQDGGDALDAEHEGDHRAADEPGRQAEQEPAREQRRIRRP